MSTIISLCFICLLSAGVGDNGYPKKDIQLPRNKVAASLLEHVKICQEQGCHNFCAGHTPVHTGVQVSGAQDKCLVPAVVRQYQDQPIQVSAPRDPKTRRRPHSAPNPLAVPAQTALSGTGIYTRPTASSRKNRKDQSYNGMEPLSCTRGGRVHLPSLEDI